MTEHPSDIQPHEPRMHRIHTSRMPIKPCGCATPDDGKPHFTCKLCGAVYDTWEVMTFPVWRCYDCGAGYASDEMRYQRGTS